jgi:hypothetical protein
MSSSNDVIIAWKIAGHFFQIVGPMIIVIGLVGCIVNLVVFTRKNLRKNPCAIYFIAFNISNILVICSLLLQLTMSVGYNIDPSLLASSLCRLRVYAAVLFNTLSPFYLLLASIDRTLVTSANARTRQRSTRRLALVSLAVGTIFWALFHIHVFIYSTILQLSPTYIVCYFQRGVYRAFVSYYLLMKEVITLSLMTLSGLWSIKNVQRMCRIGVAGNSSRIRTDIGNTMHSTSLKDRQMILMLVLDALIYALFSSTYATCLIYQQITQFHIKSAERVEIERVITNFCLFAIGIPCCTSCYVNLVASKTFRKEVKKVFC